jgi:hypothetical protein
MPFLVSGGAQIYDGDMKRFYNKPHPATGLLEKVLVQDGEYKTPLRLGFGDECNFIASSPEFKEIVYRGVPNLKDKNWMVNPVWRVPSNRYFNLIERSGDEIDCMPMYQAFKRLLEFYKLNLTQPDQVIWYEPDIADIMIQNWGSQKNWHFPLWLIKELMKMGEFENALKRRKLSSDGGEYVLTQQEYEQLMGAIKEREAIEAETLEETESLGLKVLLKSYYDGKKAQTVRDAMPAAQKAKKQNKDRGELQQMISEQFEEEQKTANNVS